jgi:pentatricopeptide repeat protein
VVLGSFDSLQWHLVETMIAYWAEEQQEVQGLDKCFQLLDRLVDESCENRDSGFKIDIYLIHAILKRWKRLLKDGKVDLLPSQVLEKVDDYLSRSNLFEPNIATYTLILDGASHCRNPAERIVFTEELLGRLIEESDHNPLVRPTVVTFSSVINAWGKSGSAMAVEKAEALLWRVHDLHENSGWPDDSKPNDIMYTSVISAWAKAGNPDRAELILKNMYEDCMLHGNTNVKPNNWAFNSVMFAWSKSPSPLAVDSAEALLRKMIELNENGVLDSRPDVVSYNILIQTILRRKMNYPEAVAKAESLVQEMIEIEATTGFAGVMPNLITYTALFRILAASHLPDRAEKAKYWLEKAKEHGISEDRFLLDQYQTMARQCEALRRQLHSTDTNGDSTL